MKLLKILKNLKTQLIQITENCFRKSGHIKIENVCKNCHLEIRRCIMVDYPGLYSLGENVFT